MIVDLPYPHKSKAPNKGAWTTAEIAMLRSLHGRAHVEVAAALGRSRAAVRNKYYELGLTNPIRWSAEAEAALIELYTNAGPNGYLNLDAFCRTWNYSKGNVSRKAKQLGLPVNMARQKCVVRKVRVNKYLSDAERSDASSQRAKRWLKENGHPRGMRGKRHTDETRARVATASKDFWATVSTDRMAEINEKRLRSRVASQGAAAPNHAHGSWKAGWREIGGKRNYYRSRWEANYARYLEWLKQQGQIQDWQHEPETFWFEQIKRGVRSYLPDFRVWENDGTSGLHEVKGWMDSRSKTTLSRMKKYHPQEKITLIRERDYNAIARVVSRLIEGWEHSGRTDRC